MRKRVHDSIYTKYASVQAQVSYRPNNWKSVTTSTEYVFNMNNN